MDLLDPPEPSVSTRTQPRPQARKAVILSGALVVALGLSVRHGGADLAVDASAPLRAASQQPAGPYDLAQLPVITRTLFFVRENYFDKGRFNHKRMLVGALDFLQRDVPEILIDRYPEREPTQVRVRVGGQEKVFDITGADSPWTMRRVLQDIFRFVQPNLSPVGGRPEDEARRLLAVEVAAANGLLYTLDPHSVLLDVDSYREMRTQTQGKFGGLGIIIRLDEQGRLMVVRPMPDTPAQRAGIQAGDRIVRIDNESTINMTRDDAIERLRGDVGAPVDLYVERAAWKGPRRFTVTRDTIRSPALEPAPRVLTVPVTASSPAGAKGAGRDKIGYFRIGQFNANTQSEVLEALELFERERVKGIIMDLRGNPGGLYDQAQKVADAFIDAGVLVSMVGVGGAQRRDEHASRDGNLKVPLAVLVNQLSASASEIVAGAVKNLDRGIVIGETSFGKGTVQILFDVPSPVASSTGGDLDRLGLKLTTAQYLTPGDRSIQGVGVTPDVDLVPLRVQRAQNETDESFIQLQRSTHRRQESDYEWALGHPSAQRGGPPAETVAYLQPAASERRPGAAGPAPDPEEGAGQRSASPVDEAAVDVPLDEDDPVDFPVELARDLLARAGAARRPEFLAAAHAYLDEVRAQEERKLAAALEPLGVDWSAGPANPPAGQVQVSLTSPSGSRPVGAGETVKVRGTVKNVGSTPVHRVHTMLTSENPYFDENEMVFGRIGPGESKSFDLTLKVGQATLTRTDVIRATVFAQGPLRANTPELTLQVQGKPRPLFAYQFKTIDDVSGNRDGRVQPGEKVRLQVEVKNIGPGPALKTEAVLRNGPGQPGILISAGRFEAGPLAPGASRSFGFVYEVTKEFRGDAYQMELVVGDPALGESVAGKVQVKVGAPVTAGGAGEVRPPVLAVTAPALATGPTVAIQGVASDDQAVRDVFIRVYNRAAKVPPRKVFYLPNRGSPTRLPFQSEVPLWPGSNIIQVFAREKGEVSGEVSSLATVVVLQKTPPKVAKVLDPSSGVGGSGAGTRPAEERTATQ